MRTWRRNRSKTMSGFAFRMPFMLLLLWGTIPAALAGSSLECTNDFEELMSCCFEAQNCSEHTLTVGNIDRDEENQCGFQEGDAGLCCCSVQMLLVFNEGHKATVWRGKENVESKSINITTSFKPKAPTLVSVKESNGNLQLLWKTNTRSNYTGTTLTANVTYYKKGSGEKVTKSVASIIVDRLKYYEILGRDLEPSTTYVFSVRSYTGWSGRYSDSSQEVEFTTAASSLAWHLGSVIALSAAAVLVTAAAFGCYYRIRAKWADAVAKCPKPKLLDVLPETEKGKLVLKPLPNDFSLVSVDAAAPNGGSTRSDSGSPGLSAGSASPGRADIRAGVQDALSHAFAHIRQASGGRPASSPYSPGAVRAHFDNMTYVSDPQPPTTGSSVDNMTWVKPEVSSLMTTDKSYQSYARDSLLESTQNPSHQAE